jgi:type VI protein secretion system component VasF
MNSYVLLLAALILALGFVIGQGRYQVIHQGVSVVRLDRWTGEAQMIVPRSGDGASALVWRRVD